MTEDNENNGKHVEEANLRRDIRSVVVDIHDNFYDDTEHYFDVLTEYVLGMITMSAEILTKALRGEEGTA